MGLRPSGPAILVVCTGNVCRSPYLEHLLRDRLDRVWGPGLFAVTSAGVRGLVGAPMTGESARLLQAEGIDGSDFTARRLSAAHLTSADMVICATRTHRSAAVQLAPSLLRRAVLLPELALARAHLSAPPASSGDTFATARGEEQPSDDLSAWLRDAARAVVNRRPTIVGTVAETDLDIDDPYGGSREAYERMKQQIGRWLPDAVAALSPTYVADQSSATTGF